MKSENKLLTPYDIRGIIITRGSEIIGYSIGFVVILIISDFRTNCNNYFRKGEKILYKKYVLLRDGNGVTDYEVSKQTGISSSTFSDWKSGRSNPKIEKLKKIADYFGVTVDYFLR